MAKKSKGFKKSFRGKKKSPDNNANISKIFESFIEPWLEMTETEDDMRRLIKIAVIAWNLSLSSESEQQERTNQLLAHNIDQENAQIKADIEDFINRLIIRKNRDFPQCKQLITDFDLEDLGDTYQICLTLIPDD